MRAILVEAPVSSRKTSLVGSSDAWEAFRRGEIGRRLWEITGLIAARFTATQFAERTDVFIAAKRDPNATGGRGARLPGTYEVLAVAP
jgi:hypothetical protein